MKDYSCFEAMPIGVMIVSPETDHVLYINKWVRDVTGIDTLEENSVSWRQFVLDNSTDTIDTETSRQLDTTGHCQFSCPSMTRNGPRWFSICGCYYNMGDGERVICLTLNDITEQKDIEISLRNEKKLNHVIFEFFNDIIFTIDLKTMTITYSDNALNVFNISVEASDFPNCVLRSTMMVKGQEQKVLNISEAMRKGVAIDTELMLRNIYGVVDWYCIRYDFVRDNDGSPIKSVGTIKSIGEQKKLQRKAELDPLTGLYNKLETQARIENILSSGEEGLRCAFFIVDIDNFKGVNDSLGHHFGDMVLVDIAKKIKHQFRECDIIGRIGGDEFVVFLKNVDHSGIVVEKAIRLSEAFRHSFTGENKNYKISGSIGVSLYPQHGATYNELYRNSDRALYESKRSGKDCYTIFHNDIYEEVVDSNKEFEDPKRCEEAFFDGHLLYSIFNLLYESKDIYASVNKALEVIGREFGVDRCYVFEACNNGQIFDNTFEWCNDGIVPQISTLQGITVEDLRYALDKFNDDGIFYCNDIAVFQEPIYSMLERQGIKSMLQCGITIKNTIQAVVGFDECKAGRVWGAREIMTLSYVSRLIGIYLFNREIHNELREMSHNKNMLLENMSGYVYVVDIKTHELLFLNQGVKVIAPSAKCGDKCYAVAFGADKPCKECPMRLLTNTNSNATLEIYNNRFDVWTLATASKLKWIGSETAALISCVDISKYKKPLQDPLQPV